MSRSAPERSAAQDVAADGRSTRWEAHREARRAELARAARRAVHRRGPDVSMDEIAAAAGTSKSIVYRYFVDKPGLQAAVGAAVVADLNVALDEAGRRGVTPRDGLRAMIDAYLAMVEASPNVYWFVTRPVSEHASAPLGHFMDAVATLVARPFARLLSGHGDGALADLWGSGAVGFVRGAGEWWLAHRDDPDAPTRAELTERVTTWLWTGPVSALARSGEVAEDAAGAPRQTRAAGATADVPSADTALTVEEPS
ncbi:TetR/AcrR family transcriptional regulator [Actinotalea sp. M2MS4P-6]|uniref:TetR/AcrR family transcriptional regulator n=1 Tax=Actinotalea sp. M2MS4P-6 TaxID=2983762 RepID=UPI0021E4F87A|nr:TetR/AcrR family transcriptional regulator [Actinotalea sp. M2MS4P-6]MCV2395292.1 TetR/AcrR family transcriptional regulator [Actinotalea sp. M2MS4P-6]